MAAEVSLLFLSVAIDRSRSNLASAKSFPSLLLRPAHKPIDPCNQQDVRVAATNVTQKTFLSEILPSFQMFTATHKGQWQAQTVFKFCKFSCF